MQAKIVQPKIVQPKGLVYRTFGLTGTAKMIYFDLIMRITITYRVFR